MQKLNVLSEGPSLEMSSFCLFFSGSNIATQHSNCNCIPLQLLSHSSKKHMLTAPFPFEISVYKKHDQSAIIALLK
jgi:hypothetical protein